jgi:hypothetical protein
MPELGCWATVKHKLCTERSVRYRPVGPVHGTMGPLSSDNGPPSHDNGLTVMITDPVSYL